MITQFFGAELVSILAVIGIFLVPIAIIWVIFAIIKANNERKVKLAMVEQGLKPEMPVAKNKKGTVVLWACSLVGVGAGFALATLLANETAQIAAVVAMLGLGMLGGYFLQSCLAKREAKCKE